MARDGARSLTLEAVAAEAGASKGGLLYHFESKPALITALVEDLIERFDELCGKHAAKGGPGARTGAYLRATVDEASLELDRASAGILAAVANDPSLLEPLRAAYRRWQGQFVDDGIDPVSATIVRLAVDGLWFSQLLGLAPIPHPLRARVIERLGLIAAGRRAP